MALEQYTAALQIIEKGNWPDIKEALIEYYKRYRSQPENVIEVEKLARRMGMNKTD